MDRCWKEVVPFEAFEVAIMEFWTDPATDMMADSLLMFLGEEVW